MRAAVTSDRNVGSLSSRVDFQLVAGGVPVVPASCVVLAVMWDLISGSYNLYQGSLVP